MASTDDPDFWTSKADEVRTIAGGLKDEARRALVVRIAEDYDLLASLTKSQQSLF